MADLILSRDEIFIQKIGSLPSVGTLKGEANIPVFQDGVTGKSTISKVKEGMVTEEDFNSLLNSSISGSLLPESHLITAWFTDGSNVGTLSTSEDIPNSQSGYSISLTHNGTSANANTNLIYSAIPAGIIKDDQDYTFSVWAKGNVPNLIITCLLKSINPTQETVGSQSQLLTTEWKRYSFTFTPTKDYNDCRYEIRVGDNGVIGTFFLFNPRLDRGDIPNQITVDYDKSKGRLENKQIDAADNTIKLYNNSRANLASVSIGVSLETGTTKAKEDELGVKFNHRRLFSNISAWVTDNPSILNSIKRHLLEDREVLYNCELKDPSGEANLSKIINGQFDTELTRMANTLAGLGKPIYLTILHEFNNSSVYSWALNYSGTNNTSNNPADFVPAYQYVVNLIRNIAPNVLFEWQVMPLWTTGSSSTNQNDYFDYYPGDDYVDLIGLSLYNVPGRSTLSDRSFRERIQNFYQQTTRFSRNPLCISEGSVLSSGYFYPISFTVNNGGSEYTNQTTLTINGDGTGASIFPIITSGVITGVDVVDGGINYTTATVVISDPGGGSGASITATPIILDKPQWVYNAFDALKDFPRLAYYTWFFHNKQNTTQFDYLDLNSPEEKRSFTEGYRLLTNRIVNDITSSNKIIRPNLLRNWTTTSNWVQSGSNQGTLGNSGIIPYDVTCTGQSLTLTHNGTPGLPNTNEIYQLLPFNSSRNNKPHSISFWAKSSVDGIIINCSTQQDLSPFGVSEPGKFKLTTFWKRYSVTLTHFWAGTFTNWRIKLGLGANLQACTIYLYGIKFEEGDFPTDYVDDISSLGQGNYLGTRIARTGNYTVPSSEKGSHYEITTSGGNAIITLPPANAGGSVSPLFYSFRKTASSVNNVIIQRVGSDNVLGASSYILIEPRETVTLMSNGSDSWFVVSRYIPSLTNVSGSIVDTNSDQTISGIKTFTNTNPLNLNSSSGQRSEIRWNNDSGLRRWVIFKTEDVETGDGQGSDLAFRAYNDAGNSLGDVIKLDRNTKRVELGGALVLSTTIYGDPGSLWRLNNVLQYKDGVSVTRTLLNAEDNLSNLTNTITAKTNLKTLTSRIINRTSNYIVLSSDEGTLFDCDATSGAFTMTLPSAASNPNVIYTFRKSDGSSNIVTISTTDNILGQSSYLLTTNREIITLVSNGGAWVVVSRDTPTVGTATATAGAATLSSRIGRVTTESLTTAAGGTYTLTITNSVVTSTSAITATITGGTNTTGVPVLLRAVPGSGTITVTIRNMDASAALNGNLVVSYSIVN
ncbi:phage head spike fiber domain-containing protein [Nostoc sp. UHCC 0870]|uniref:phage head spike fiber domain-containing protein n=1 Tax=Nostoc sp. UHCC 0870 TaxID=2914041 RepID=UPI001EDF05E8|nr:carbohydrate binding domain-containing protein [Nostoc sp. UHCC 0870]UKO99353.1 carbohydrate binding domain-containing protein [Nostoc sp. UHCC 0870]